MCRYKLFYRAADFWLIIYGVLVSPLVTQSQPTAATNNNTTLAHSDAFNTFSSSHSSAPNKSLSVSYNILYLWIDRTNPRTTERRSRKRLAVIIFLPLSRGSRQFNSSRLPNTFAVNHQHPAAARSQEPGAAGLRSLYREHVFICKRPGSP